jgi:HPt (histidine-containing phosphotransfer) domain-containing protein
MSSLPVLDPDVFQELQETIAQRPDSIATIYTTFMANALRVVTSLTLATVSVREQQLHVLKGSASMVGAARIAKLAGDLQAVCPHLPVQAMEAGIRRLEEELSAFRQAVNARLDRVHRGPPAG